MVFVPGCFMPCLLCNKIRTVDTISQICAIVKGKTLEFRRKIDKSEDDAMPWRIIIHLFMRVMIFIGSGKKQSQHDRCSYSGYFGQFECCFAWVVGEITAILDKMLDSNCDV